MNNNFLITKIERIIFVDKNEYSENYTHFTGTLYHNELIFHISGNSTIYFNGIEMEIKPNIIRFLPKCKIYEYNVFRKESGACIDIFFETDKPISDKAFVLNVQENKKIAALFNKIFSIWVAKDEGYTFECISILYKIFAEMQKKNYVSEKVFLKIKPAIDFINANFLSDNISSETLSQICGISYSYITRLFIKKFGVSPIKYAIQLRINFACDLLLTNMYSISQVAEQCGYTDMYFFSRQFKEYVGISPKKYIHKYKSSK